MNSEMMLKNGDDLDILESMSDRELMFYIFLEMKSLKKRMEDHSKERQAFSESVYKKLDEIKQEQKQDKEELIKKIADVEIASVRDDKITNTKVATISGTLSLVVALVTAWVVSMISGRK